MRSRQADPASLARKSPALRENAPPEFDLAAHWRLRSGLETPGVYGLTVVSRDALLRSPVKTCIQSVPGTGAADPVFETLT